MGKFGGRIKETTSSTGTGTISLAGAPTGFRGFAEAFASGDKVDYLLVDSVSNPTEFEWGEGTFTAGAPNTLSRDTVFRSSNSNNKVAWAASPIAACAVHAESLNRAFGGVALASAGTVAIGAASGHYIQITGTTAITAFDSVTAGTWRILRFAAAATLTHHATSLILPGGANIVTAAGDTAIVVSEGSGNWRCTAYHKADGRALTVDAPATTIVGGHIRGLRVSTNVTDADHDIDIAAGEATDAAAAVLIALAASMTKRLDATWAAGTNQGGLSSSLVAPANSTWYHIFAMIVAGAADIGIDTDFDGANLIADHGATAVRRIRSKLTDGSANFIDDFQRGDNVIWVDPPLDVNDANGDTAGALATMSVPTGVEVIWRGNVLGSALINYVSSPDQDNEAPSISDAPLASSYDGGNAQGVYMEALTDASAQLRYRTSTGSPIFLSTIGYRDSRGRFD